MRLQLLSYQSGTGWSAPIDTALDSQQTLALVFGAPELGTRPAPFDELRRALPEARIIGCSTAGEVLDTRIQDGSLAVAIIRFSHTRIRTTVRPLGGAGQSHAVGRHIARDLAAPDLHGVLMLSDGLDVNGSGLVAGVTASLPPGIPVSGGLAGDGSRFAHTWVLDHTSPRPGLVSAVGFYGERIRITHGSRGGWRIFGPERRVTRSVGNVLYELDGRNALEIYRNYLGELAAGPPATGLRFPLSLRASASADARLVRTILAVDDAQGSLTFAGDIPEGYLATLMRASADDLITGAEDAAREAAPADEHAPVLAIAISCVGRRMVLGERAEEELEASLGALPPGSRQIGFCSYGELSPVGSGSCELHNQTMTLTTIREIGGEP